jgi:hypothetical protein
MQIAFISKQNLVQAESRILSTGLFLPHYLTLVSDVLTLTQYSTCGYKTYSFTSLCKSSLNIPKLDTFGFAFKALTWIPHPDLKEQALF